MALILLTFFVVGTSGDDDWLIAPHGPRDHSYFSISLSITALVPPATLYHIYYEHWIGTTPSLNDLIDKKFALSLKFWICNIKNY